MDKTKFLTPDNEYRVFPMTHGWMGDYKAHMEAYRDFGYGGAVTNVPFGGGFTSNPENLRAFGQILDGIGQLAAAPLFHFDSGTILLSQGLELCHQSGNAFLTLCRVDDVYDLIIGRQLCHVCTSFWTNGPHSR